MEPPVKSIDRRSFFSFSWKKNAEPTPPTTAITHEEGGLETQLLNGRVASYLRWPSFALTNHRSQRVDLHRDVLAGHPVVLSFFYTQCKGSCPVTTGRMMELERLLRAQKRPVRFVSISLEPEEDTPAVLAEYARHVIPTEADWHLLTTDAQTLKGLRQHLGFYDLDPAVDADPRRHAAMVLMGNDATHRWFTLPAMSTLRQWRSTLSRCTA